MKNCHDGLAASERPAHPRHHPLIAPAGEVDLRPVYRTAPGSRSEIVAMARLPGGEEDAERELNRVTLEPTTNWKKIQVPLEPGAAGEERSFRIEVNENVFTDEIKGLERLEKGVEKEIKDILGISAKVRLVEPKTIERFEGKATRVIDNREI